MIRLLNLLVLAACLPWLDLLPLLVAFVGLSCALLIAGRDALLVALQRLWQLRWLMLSLAILYLGFTPGEDGAHQGLRNLLLLTCMVMSVGACLHGMSSDELASAVSRLARPLARVGVPSETFGRRLALTLERVANVRSRIDEARRSRGLGPPDLLASLCADLEAEAGQGCDVRPPATPQASLGTVGLVQPVSLALLLVLAQLMLS